MNFEKEWQKAIRECKKLVNDRFEMKLKIAEKAIKCCYREDGTPRPTEYSLKRFADEVGLKHSTLKEWVNLKRTVYDKLDSSQKGQEPITTYRLIRKIAGTQASKTKVRKVFKELKKKGGAFLKYQKYIDHLTSIKYNSQLHEKLTEASEGQLLEIQTMCLEISENITNFRKRKRVAK